VFLESFSLLSTPHPLPQAGGGLDTGKAGQRPPGIADEPTQQEDFPIPPRHVAESPLPQIGRHDNGIELDREQDAGARIKTLAGYRRCE
jgi:hypothetical protein